MYICLKLSGILIFTWHIVKCENIAAFFLKYVYLADTGPAVYNWPTI